MPLRNKLESPSWNSLNNHGSVLWLDKFASLSSFYLRYLSQFLGLTLLLINQSSAAELQRLKSQMVPMRDGVELSTDIYLSTTHQVNLPAVLIRTVYNKNNTFEWNPVWAELVEQGYAIVIQDIRGRFESGGEYAIAAGRRTDGIDTLDWLIEQPWSNGKVALAGCSYLGETQVVLAATNHPSLVTAIPMSAASGYYEPGRAWQAFSGGAFELGQTAGWFAGSGSKVYTQPPPGTARGEYFQSLVEPIEMTPPIDFSRYLDALASLPVIDVLDRAGVPDNDFRRWRESHPDGDYFRNLDLVTAEDSTSIPMLFMDSWYDYGATETLAMMETFERNAQTEQAKEHQFLVIGPGTHCNYDDVKEDTRVGTREVGDARFDYAQLQRDWYNFWLKGERNAVLDRPRIQYYQLGTNEWRSTETWPPEGSEYQRWYLSSSRGANSLDGDGVLLSAPPENMSVDEFSYDPADPVPSLGGHTCCTGTDTEAGGYDQRAIEQREDVLVYTSEVLDHNVEMAGRIRAVLTVSSSAVDTDFSVKLVDVYPTGEAFNIQEGMLRMRYRDSLTEATLMKPGERYQIEIDLHTTANTFLKGHQIRVEISSSNYPRIERNLNTGGNNYDEVSGVIAENSVFTGPEIAGYVEFPVLP
ncbi:CocE/NonD family hydrolase [uncultured Umboniibacter sp.]|uniref:CocE/NonD family hydrolase n=1 Tax=uncultured Umboniibacter sp. TaxID=1798917 RepID=UPI0026106813|nr:CocE/NonD family hydrolase [uncultured Umboniibacter sp.]